MKIEKILFPTDFSTCSDDLAVVQQFTDKQLPAMTANLRQIVDLRLEERENVDRALLWIFTCAAHGLTATKSSMRSGKPNLGSFPCGLCG